KLSARLAKRMMTVVKSDTTSIRGQRSVTKGNIQLLEGFEFNVNGVLSATLNAPYSATINRVTGALSVNIPSFTPAMLISAPQSATHFKIVSAGIELDFDNEVSNSDVNES